MNQQLGRLASLAMRCNAATSLTADTRKLIRTRIYTFKTEPFVHVLFLLLLCANIALERNDALASRQATKLGNLLPLLRSHAVNITHVTAGTYVTSAEKIRPSAHATRARNNDTA